MRQAARLLLTVSLLVPAPLLAEPLAEACANGSCTYKLSVDQMLAHASMLVQARRFDEARPVIAALGHAPGLAMETHFLKGYVAVETGDVAGAIREFRASLAVDPKQTRVRLELARALALQGQDAGASYHYRLAAQDKGIAPEIRATIQAQRGILRDRKPWRLSTSFGFAPDTNINSGSSAETVDVLFGGQPLPLQLDDQARARSGIGQTASFSAGYRVALGEKTGLQLDADASGTNYKGVEADDYTVQLAAGPELRPSDATTLSLQLVGAQRWYGGSRAATQVGARFSAQHTLSDDQRIGVSLDARHNASGFGAAYSGWNFGAYATYERVVARSLIASASLFARVDRLNEAAFSSREFGVSLGLGGELGHGINAGISGTASRATFDAPMLAFSIDPRRDWRLSGRIYAGLRTFRFLGFSPSIAYTYTLNAASLPLYQSKRSRFAFALARYF